MHDPSKPKSSKPSKPKPRRPRAKPEDAQGVSLHWRKNGIAVLVVTDPNTGVRKTQSLRTRSKTVAERALATRRTVARAAREKTTVYEVMLGRKLEPMAIETVLRSYYNGLAKSPKRSDDTLYNMSAALKRFLRFCHARGVEQLTELDMPTLEAFAQHVYALPGRSGGTYKASSCNQAFKPVRAAFKAFKKLYWYAPHLSNDMLRDAMPYAKLGGERNQYLHDVVTARAMPADELRTLMHIALDASGIAACAPDLMLFLLYGLRGAEAGYARLALVDDAHAINLPVELGKGSVSRVIPSEKFTVMGAELLRVLKRGRSDYEWLTERSYPGMHSSCKRLAQLMRAHYVDAANAKDPHNEVALAKAQAYTFKRHDLRASCATWQLSIKDMDVKRLTGRMGHTLAIADGSYLQPLPNQPVGMSTLEDAMGLQDEFLAAIRQAYERNTPRTAPRKRKLRNKGFDDLPRKPGKPRKSELKLLEP